MLEFIRGIIVSIYPTSIIVEANGVGHHILTANPYLWQDSLGQETQVYCELVTRQDDVTLYGFKSQEDKQLFLTLIKVSGIGPKSAMSIMAANDNEGLVQAIEKGDSQYLTKFPGVGKKTAQQMILDLSNKLDFVSREDAPQAKPSTDQLIEEEILEALSGLGYSQREINRVSKELSNHAFESTQDGLSFAFKLLLNK